MFTAKSDLFPRLLVATLFLATVSPAIAAQHQVRKPTAKRDEPAVVLDTEAPAAPLSPEQRPASPPQVTFQNGMLTIVSQNSTLGDILRAVHAHTGATMDVPPNATERVVANLGPGPARDILAALLNGSHFNYVMLGSATDAHALDRVILTPKTATSSGTVDAALKAPPPPANQADADDDDDSADADTEDDAEDTQAESQSGDEDAPQAVQQVDQGQPGVPNVRTPEQILQQMRQQQLQQQQGQQPGTTPGQPAPQPFPGQPNPNQPPPN